MSLEFVKQHFELIAVTVEPASFVNDIESPFFKSVLKFVPLPKRFAELFAIEILPELFYLFHK